MWITWAVAGAWGCDLEGLEGHLAAAEHAFVVHDGAALSAALREVDQGLSCVKEVIPPKVCARIHFVHALEEWSDDGTDRGLASLRAALHAEPLFRLPVDTVPEGHLLRVLAWQAEEAPERWTASREALLVDGLRSGAVPLGQPYIAQRLAADGSPRDARRTTSTGTPAGGGGGGAGPVLRWTGVGVGVVGGGLLGAAWSRRIAYDQALEAGEVERWDALHQSTNTLSVASFAAGVVGAGLFSVSFAVR